MGVRVRRELGTILEISSTVLQQIRKSVELETGDKVADGEMMEQVHSRNVRSWHLPQALDASHLSPLCDA